MFWDDVPCGLPGENLGVKTRRASGKRFAHRCGMPEACDGPRKDPNSNLQ